MSSFRPDAEGSAPSFVARPLLGNVSRALEGDSADEPAVEFLSTVDSDVDAEEPHSEQVSETPPVYSEEEVLARENAAFERGAAAAQVDVSRTEDAFAALEQAGAAYAEAARSAVGANRAGVLELASEIARRWVGLELSLSGDRFLASLEAALERVDVDGGGSIRLNAEDLSRIKNEASEQLSQLSESTGLSLEADATIGSTEFEVDLGTCSIDGRADGVLERLRVALSEVVASDVSSDVVVDVSEDVSEEVSEDDPADMQANVTADDGQDA